MDVDDDVYSDIDSENWSPSPLIAKASGLASRNVALRRGLH